MRGALQPLACSPREVLDYTKYSGRCLTLSCGASQDTAKTCGINAMPTFQARSRSLCTVGLLREVPCARAGPCHVKL